MTTSSAPPATQLALRWVSRGVLAAPVGGWLGSPLGAGDGESAFLVAAVVVLMAGSLAWSLFGLFGHRLVTWQDSCEARWQPPGRTRGAHPVRLQEPCNLRIWGFLPSRERACAAYRRRHGDLGPRHARSQSRRPRGRRPRADAAAPAGAARSHAGAGDEHRPPGRRVVGRGTAGRRRSDAAVARRPLAPRPVGSRRRPTGEARLCPRPRSRCRRCSRPRRPRDARQHGPGRGASRRGQQRADRSAEPVARDAVRRVRRL